MNSLSFESCKPNFSESNINEKGKQIIKDLNDLLDEVQTPLNEIASINFISNMVYTDQFSNTDKGKLNITSPESDAKYVELDITSPRSDTKSTELGSNVCKEYNNLTDIETIQVAINSLDKHPSLQKRLSSVINNTFKTVSTASASEFAENKDEAIAKDQSLLRNYSNKCPSTPSIANKLAAHSYALPVVYGSTEFQPNVTSLQPGASVHNFDRHSAGFVPDVASNTAGCKSNASDMELCNVHDTSYLSNSCPPINSPLGSPSTWACPPDYKAANNYLGPGFNSVQVAPVRG